MIQGDPEKVLKYFHRLPRRPSGVTISANILEDLMKVLGEKQYPTFLNSGYHASVYWLKGDRKKVLKLTTDYSDANALEIIRKKPDPRSFLKVHAVYEIEPKHSYAIVTEKLTPLSDTVWKDTFEPFFDFVTVSMTALKYNNLLYSKGLTPEYIEIIKKAIEKENLDLYENPLLGGPDKVEEYLRPVPSDAAYKALLHMGKALEQRKIVFHDFHQSNFMMRGRTPVIVDLGFGESPPQNIKPLPPVI